MVVPNVSSDNQGAGVAPNVVSSPTEPAPKDNPISIAQWLLNVSTMKDGTKFSDFIAKAKKDLATSDEIRELIIEEIKNNKDFYTDSITNYIKSSDILVGSWYKNLDGSLSRKEVDYK